MNWERLVSCVLVLSMILGGFTLMANDAEAGLDFITDISSLDGTYRGQDWHPDGDFMIAVGNDSSNNGIVHKYDPADGSWSSLASVPNDRYNAVANVEAFTWYDNMEMGTNGWTSETWGQSSTPVGYTPITNVWELQNITNDLAGDYVLANDIDASITVGWNGGQGFVPMGPFSGTLEGAGHKIINLCINRLSVDYTGLFSTINSLGIVSNITFDNVDVKGGLNTGSLVGYNYGVVSNVSVSGSVQADGANTGGLVGQSQGWLRDCFSTATVSGTTNAGGLIGYCYAYVDRCYATGDVTATTTRSGGLAGYHYIRAINNSYATGSVTCPDTTGGFLGNLASASLKNCYSTGFVSATTNYGGFRGAGSGTVTDCFWDNITSGQATDTYATPHTTAEMMQQATFTNWDFVNIWTIDEGTSYPYFEVNVDDSVQWLQGNPLVLPDAGSGTSHGTAHSGSNIWWFGLYTTGNYDNGSRVAGSLISPVVTLPAISSVSALMFSHWFEVEYGAGTHYDSMSVSIKNTTDLGWYELKRWDSSNTSFTNWNQEILMFQGWQGNDIQVNFTFDSQDNADNDYAGWHLDDVLLYSNDVYIVVGEPGAGGYSAYATDGYSTFVDMGVNSYDFNDVAPGAISHSFLAVGDGGNVQYYDGENWNTIVGAQPDDVLTGVAFNGTHWFIVGYNSTGSGKAYYYTQAEFHKAGRITLHPIWGTPDWELNDVAWSNYHPSQKQRIGLGAVAANGTGMSFGDPELWTRENPVTGSPPARLGADMTYDIAHAASVMFGGTNTAYSNETWIHSTVTNSWYNMTPVGSPPARYGCEIVYDPVQEATILFGGYNATDYMDDTWMYWIDNNTWLELSPASSPPGRYRHEMEYDNINERIIMFGGLTNGGVVADTWEFSGGTWTDISPAGSPPARSSHSMSYDIYNQHMIMFGGENGAPLGDTWVFNITSNQWTERFPATTPPARFRQEMIFDAGTGITIMFGGHDSVDYLGDTWIYNMVEDEWYNIYPNQHPSARRDFGFVFDYFDGEPKLYGGMNGAAISDTWQCSFLTPWNGNVVDPAIGLNGENLTAVKFDSSGLNALFVGHNETANKGVVYAYYSGNDYISIVPGTDTEFTGHRFFDIGYVPGSTVDEAIILGQSAFKILPNLADTSTRIFAYSEYPNILDIDFRDQSSGITRENQQVDADEIYTFFIEANYTIGAVDMWNDLSLNLIAWYDEGQIGSLSSPEDTWATVNNRTRQFNITYDVSAGTAVVNYPTAPDLEFTIVSSWEDPFTYANSAHRVYINVSFGEQTRMATGQGFVNGAAGDILDKNSAHDDPFSWDYMFYVYDELNTDAFVEAYEEFGIREAVSISVSGNPAGNAPPGSVQVGLSNPSIISYSANTDYWVNVSIPNLYENGILGAINRINCDDVYVQNMCLNVTAANSDIDLQYKMPIAENQDVYVWGQAGSPISAPSTGTNATGPFITNYNATIWGDDDFTQLNWAVTVQAATPEGIYWAIITITIDS